MSLKKVIISLLILISGGIVFYWFAIFLPLPKINQVFLNLSSWVEKRVNLAFPPDLEINIKNGKITINRPSPYCLIVDEELRMGIVFDQNPTQVAFSQPFASYLPYCQPITLVGPDFIVYPGENSQFDQYKIFRVPKDVNFSLNRPAIDNFIAQYLPLAQKAGKWLYFLLPLILISFALSTIILINLWYGFVVYLLGKIIKRPVTFKNAYTISLSLLIFISLFDILVFGYLVNRVANLNFHWQFPFSRTLVIGVTSLFFLRKPLPNFTLKKDRLPEEGEILDPGLLEKRVADNLKDSSHEGVSQPPFYPPKIKR